MTRLKRKCAIPECEKPSRVWNLCVAHYYLKKHNGDPLLKKKQGRAPGELNAWIERHVATEQDDCLIWPYYRNKQGYAVISAKSVHRMICERVNGAPPSPAHQAAHNCGNGHLGCVNPKHLRWATPKENCADRVAHGTETRGDRCANARLNAQSVREIRTLAATTPVKELAAQYGVSIGTLRSAIRGNTWSWVE